MNSGSVKRFLFLGGGGVGGLGGGWVEGGDRGGLNKHDTLGLKFNAKIARIGRQRYLNHILVFL